MAQAPIRYAAHKNANGTFALGFDNLTKAEAAEYLLLLARQQDQRGEPVADDGKTFEAADRWRAQLDEQVTMLTKISRA